MRIYTDSMGRSYFEKSEREAAYKIHRGWGSAKAGAAIGMLLGGLVCMLFSRWLPEQFFVPIILITGAVFAVAIGLFWPMELGYHNFDDDPDNITPAERVERLQTEVRAESKADN